jgi:hypothetical protein
MTPLNLRNRGEAPAEAAVDYGVKAVERMAATALDRERPDPLWESVTAELERYIVDMTSANSPFFAVTRSRWLEALVQTWAQIGSPGERTASELRSVQRALRDLQLAFEAVQEEAADFLMHLMDEYAMELADLMESELPEDVKARQVIESAWAQTQKRIDAVGKFMVLEDLVPFHHLLDTGAHIKQGARLAQEEWKRQQRLERDFEDEAAPNMPSAAQFAWEVVGWTDAGDFASDVALTVVTAGAGKAVKWIVKARRAKKRLHKLRNLSQARKLRKTTRTKKLAEGAARLAAAVGDALEQIGGISYTEWVKANWKRTARRYITDELGEALGGGDVVNKNILERISKDAVDQYVVRALRISAEVQRNRFKVALLAYAAGQPKFAFSALSTFLSTSFKRRLLGNCIFTGLHIGTFQKPLSPAAVIEIANKTVGEMLQDIADQVVGNAIVRFGVETVRKQVETAVTNWVTTGLK